jgi:hypothetical protein
MGRSKLAGIVTWSVRAVIAVFVLSCGVLCAELERSYWLHASLGSLTQKGYWGEKFPPTPAPGREQVQRAARLLAGPYAANRLYLVYHGEMTATEARQVFGWWREVCPKSVELVPALVLRMYDKQQTPVFTSDELREWAAFFKQRISAPRVAVYDVHAGREQGEGVKVLAGAFPDGLVRLGLQPGEPLAPPFVAAVQDTWSAFCHGRRNAEDWQQPGFGADTLRQWVGQRNTGAARIAWDLIVVAWDYAATARGAYPGYDDAAKNMPLPAGRNRLAAGLIRRAADARHFAGFSSDLCILQANSHHAAHDGPKGAFYETLKRGEEYGGCYAQPLREITEIFREMRRAQ